MKTLKAAMAAMIMLGLVFLNTSGAKAAMYYDFDSSTEGWAAEDWGYGTPSLDWTSWSGGALEANTSTMTYGTGAGENWAKVYLKRTLDSPQDLTSTPIYLLDIFVPDNMYVTAKLDVRVGSGLTLYEGPETAQLAQSTWQTISWDLSGTPELNDVRELGIELMGWYPLPKDTTFNIDNVATAVPEPSTALLLGIFATGLLGIPSLRRKRK